MIPVTISVPVLGWLTLTLLIYGCALFIYRKSGASPLLHPLVVSALLVFLLLLFTGVPVQEYQQSTVLLDWLLGPATVALAIPLYRQIRIVRDLGYRTLMPMLSGGIIAPLLAWSMVALLSDDIALQMTMLVKSITTPFAVEVSGISGGIPSLAAGIVIFTGVVGAITSSTVFKALNIQSHVAQGIALGTIAHAIGTAKALQMGEVTAALATMSLCINGITTAIVVPLLF